MSELVFSKFPQSVLDRYDFSKAVYHGATVPITGIICPDHGEFQQYSGQLRKPGGAGCPKCGAEKRGSAKRLSQDEAIANLVKVYGDTYDYTHSVYNGSNAKITVSCPEHGDFDVLYSNHVSGKGCPVCGAAKRGQRQDPMEAGKKTAATKIAKFAAKFVEEAIAIHGDKYDYSEVVYQGQKTPVTIICPEHGAFKQTPYHHISRKQGCPACSGKKPKGD